MKFIKSNILMIISLFVLLVLLCNSSCRYISQKQNEARMRSTFENLCLDLTDEAAITETVCENIRVKED